MKSLPNRYGEAIQQTPDPSHARTKHVLPVSPRAQRFGVAAGQSLARAKSLPASPPSSVSSVSQFSLAPDFQKLAQAPRSERQIQIISLCLVHLGATVYSRM